MTKTKLEPETALERHVAQWMKEQAKGYESGMEGVYSDLMQGGCQSDYVGHLIYYKDTIAFYKKHQKDISALIAELIDSTGEGVESLFGDKWDKSDPLANDTPNQNLLAWFGFEEAARNLCERAEGRA